MEAEEDSCVKNTHYYSDKMTDSPSSIFVSNNPSGMSL